MTGVIKNKHGVYSARRKVPVRLQEATARLLGASKERQTWLKRSLGTKDVRQANILAKPVLMEFDRTLARAEALLSEAPLRSTLSKTEIDRLADYHYAAMLAADEEETREGTGAGPLLRSIAGTLAEAGVEFKMPLPLDASSPRYGLSDREVSRRDADMVWLLPIMRTALARGDISQVSEHLDELLSLFSINLDRNSPAYRELGTAVLRANVRALEAIAARMAGQPIDTPPIGEPEGRAATPGAGENLSAALAGWRKAKNPAATSSREYGRAVQMFSELHGDLPVSQITRTHARQFREALQDVPRIRSGKLLKATLPELAQWGREHPEAQRISAATVNKNLGGVQAVAVWASGNGMVPEHIVWADPFSRMRLDEEDSDREPFEVAELQTLFSTPLFTSGERPRGGGGEAAFWLPLLALFSGARQGELAGLTVGNVQTDADTKHPVMVVIEDRERDKTLKTKSSRRTVPVHPELIRLGFMHYVTVRGARGADAWLFPELSPEHGGQPAWSKWFSRYIRKAGITDKDKVFHSLRHNFKDAIRKAGLGEDINDALTGHSGAGTVGRRYGAKDTVKRFGMPALISAVASVAYPGLDLSAIRQRR